MIVEHKKTFLSLWTNKLLHFCSHLLSTRALTIFIIFWCAVWCSFPKIAHKWFPPFSPRNIKFAISVLHFAAVEKTSVPNHALDVHTVQIFHTCPSLSFHFSMPLHFCFGFPRFSWLQSRPLSVHFGQFPMLSWCMAQVIALSLLRFSSLHHRLSFHAGFASNIWKTLRTRTFLFSLSIGRKWLVCFVRCWFVSHPPSVFSFNGSRGFDFSALVFAFHNHLQTTCLPNCDQYSHIQTFLTISVYPFSFSLSSDFFPFSLSPPPPLHLLPFLLPLPEWFSPVLLRLLFSQSRALGFVRSFSVWLARPEVTTTTTSTHAAHLNGRTKFGEWVGRGKKKVHTDTHTLWHENCRKKVLKAVGRCSLTKTEHTTRTDH